MNFEFRDFEKIANETGNVFVFPGRRFNGRLDWDYDKIIEELVKTSRFLLTLVNFKKTLLFDLAIFLIVVGALAGGLFFFGSNITSSVNQIAGLRQDIVNRSTSLNFYATLRSQYNDQAQADLNVLNNIVPTKDQLIDLPKNFQSLATQQNIGFGFSFAGETAPVPGGLGSVTFRLNLQGQTMDQLLQFIQKLEHFQYLSSLDSFNFGRQSTGVQMAVTGRVFYHQ